jgi:hypothetical protein
MLARKHRRLASNNRKPRVFILKYSRRGRWYTIVKVGVPWTVEFEAKRSRKSPVVGILGTIVGLPAARVADLFLE